MNSLRTIDIGGTMQGRRDYMAYIYALRRADGPTLYVGRTGQLQKRLICHISTWRKRGLDPTDLRIHVLEEVDNSVASIHERWWIIMYRACGVPLLNQSWDGGKHPHKGTKQSAETVAKRLLTIRARNGGKWFARTDKQREANAAWNARRVVTPEYREKISKTLTGRKNPHKGHKQSPETVAKRVAAVRARFNGGWAPRTDKCKAALAEWNERRRQYYLDRGQQK